MQIKLVFDHSGDEIIFDAVNPEVAEYYIDNLDKINSNKFTSQREFKVPSLVNELHQSICGINEYLPKLIGQELKVSTELDYLNQDLLNELHAHFVNSQSCLFDVQAARMDSDEFVRNAAETLHSALPDDRLIVQFGEVLAKLNLDRSFGKVNTDIHSLENGFFDLRFGTNKWVQFSNPFPKTILTNTIAHLQITFNHLGRPLYNKYKYFDTHLDHDDENSYNELLGFVSINLSRVQTIELSKEYVEWCSTHNKEPSGEFLNIGYIPNLAENLTKYRQLIYKNLKIQNKFSIHKG